VYFQVHHPAKVFVTANTMNNQYFRLLNPIGVSNVIAKFANPQIITLIALPCALAVLG
jgi:hypothetical protein